ncbi:MAG: hypothetical protein OEV44_06835 [Spirochaetota bacterium]|nr:hypothetical protein [Spirochaetota bacterium]
MKKIYLFIFIAFFNVFCNSKPEKSSSQDSYKEAKANYLRMYKLLPDLKPINKSKEHIIRVLYVEDPLLPSLSKEQKVNLLSETEKLTYKLLGYRISFKVIGKENIKSFFNRMRVSFKKPEFRYPILYWPVPITNTKKILSVVKKAIRKHDNTTLERYFGKPSSGKSMANHIFKLFMKRINAIYNEKDQNGKPLFNRERSEWFSFPHWDVIAYNLKDADFIITNIVLASSESTMPIYVINRGGVTSAFVENNFHNDYKAVGVFATYQYISKGKYFIKKRGVIPNNLLIPVMSHIFVHEMGHFLMRLDEYYNLKGSVHVAPIDLNYLKWYKSIDPSAHPMKPKEMKILKKY